MVYRFDDDQSLPQSRLIALSVVVVLLTALLLLGFWNLQVLDSPHYAELADRNRIRTIPIIAPRGRIYDRQGRVLLDNYPSFSVLLERDAPQQLGQYLPQIAAGLGIDPGDLQQEVADAAGLPRYQPLVILSDATPADIAFVESHRPGPRFVLCDGDGPGR